MDYSTIRGTINYVSDEDSDKGRKRGYEYFTLTLHKDGGRVQRALSIIEDQPIVVRDILESVSKDWHLQDCYVRIHSKKQFTGTGWFRFHNNLAECETFTTTEGRVSQYMTLESGPVVFCNHSIVGDAWMMTAYDISQGPGRQKVEQMLTPTLNKQGAEGPILTRSALGIEFVGKETIKVPAGIFQCLHFKTGRYDRNHALATASLNYDIWCTADSHYVTIMSMYAGKRRYEMVQWQDSTE